MGRGRKWNPAAHPRAKDGKFSRNGGWAGKIGDKIGAKRGEDVGGERKKRDDFNQEMLSQLEEFRVANADSGDPEDRDPDLDGIANDLESAIRKGDRDRADKLADEGRRYIVANGYADDNEMPSWSKQVSDRLPGGDNRHPTGSVIEDEFGPDVNTEDGAPITGRMLLDRIDTLKDNDEWEIYDPTFGDWGTLRDAFEDDTHLTQDEIDSGMDSYLEVETDSGHFTIDMGSEDMKIRRTPS